MNNQYQEAFQRGFFKAAVNNGINSTAATQLAKQAANEHHTHHQNTDHILSKLMPSPAGKGILGGLVGGLSGAAGGAAISGLTGGAPTPTGALIGGLAGAGLGGLGSYYEQKYKNKNTENYILDEALSRLQSGVKKTAMAAVPLVKLPAQSAPHPITAVKPAVNLQPNPNGLQRPYDWSHAAGSVRG